MSEWQTWVYTILGVTVAIIIFRELLFICYIAARSERGALKMILVLYNLGIGVISDILGEEVTDKKTAIRAAARYILHLRHLFILRIEHPNMHLAIAVKLSQIGMKFDKDLARRLLKKIYKTCLAYDIRLEIDVEGPETFRDALDIIKPLVRIDHNFRTAVSANQSDSEWFFLELAKLGIGIRLVKGAYSGDYKDADAICFNYLRFTHEAKKYDLDTAYGTHDSSLLNTAQSIRKGTEQMLFGVFMSYAAKWRYMPWGLRKDAKKFMRRRMQEGIRPKTILLFLRNIPESLFWRLCHAPLSFFN